MNERILEIIDFIEERFSDEFFPLYGDLYEELLFEGYSENEIEEAMSWIEAYQSEKEELATFEIAKTVNNIKMEKSAYNYLLSLLGKNVITANTFDDILNHCLLLSEEDITIEKVLPYIVSLNTLKEGWGKEARANYLAFSMKKDC
jgi:uncharacterized protein Smg (DUF494 family)